ncbi:NAD-dependent epimerase/dehydratase family protein [Lactobacillus sp. ESL0684]|uniref:NAD-dependent epimerase/dehydratase family protein n=1 Tax=Lactobacillus sp. ESL0684 TaxID=2983213 RepID=UPI0023F8911C|nr:NAD-dependent epimerase/dehydratase family protein [Lactobacillus sp. ESL0684]WEV44408.1 NAD-dependent epimerase/dehydratase family protein [Lactobacillus sp. ESL0684]
MKVVVIGGSGHIGSYLIPKLVKKGFEVISVSRGSHKPYYQDPVWNHIEQIFMDRSKDINFNEKIAKLNADIVIDLICFDLNDMKKIVRELKKTSLKLYLFCSSIWSYGRAEILPVTPNSGKSPIDEYGKQKYECEKFLKQEIKDNNFPATIIMPGQISGPGWSIINPQGNLDDTLFQKIADGSEIYLPNFGMETLHHVHASDVAQLFVDAIMHRNMAIGESFHAVSAESITLYGYAKFVYRYFDKQSKINFLPWDQWTKLINDSDKVEKTYLHIARSGQYSIKNARELLDYTPEFSVLDTIKLSIQSYLDRGVIVIR